MATLTTRNLANGETRYVVRWTVGGGRRGPDKKQDSGTLESHNQAIRFQLDVEENHHVFPRRLWQRDEYGFVVPIEVRTSSLVSLDDVAEKYLQWMEKRIAKNKVSEFTVTQYGQIYERHLATPLGDLPFTEVEMEDIEDWINDQVANGYAPKTIRNRHGILSSIMAYGQNRMKLRPDNPCNASCDELPEKDDGKKRQVRFFQVEEWKQFRKCLQPDVLLLCDLTLAAGMRIGEVLALRVGDVIANGPADVSIKIERTWTKRGKYKDAIDWSVDETVRWKLGPTKNREDRWAHITGRLAVQLLAATKDRDPKAYLFIRETKPWRYEDFLRERWNPAREQAALTRIDPTPHMLRHSFVVWALEAGKDPYRVSKAVGHGSLSVTEMIYSGHFDPTRNSIAEVMEDAMEDLHSFIDDDDDDGGLVGAR